MAAEKGNKYAQEWSEEAAIIAFIEILEYAETREDCLSLQKAVKSSNMPWSTYRHLADNQDVLARIKEDTHAAIIIRINDGTLKGDFQPTAGIWRMKQLGEKDSKELDHKSSDGSMSTKPPTKQEIEDINKDLESKV